MTQNRTRQICKQTNPEEGDSPSDLTTKILKRKSG